MHPAISPAAMHPPMMVPVLAMNHSGYVALNRDRFDQIKRGFVNSSRGFCLSSLAAEILFLDYNMQYNTCIAIIDMENYRIETHDIDDAELIDTQANKRFCEFPTVVPVIRPSPDLPILRDLTTLFMNRMESILSVMKLR